MFSCEFCQISKNTFFTKHLWATSSAYFACNRNKKNISHMIRRAITTLSLYYHSILLWQPYQLVILQKYKYYQSVKDFNYVRICCQHNDNLFISSAALPLSHLWKREVFCKFSETEKYNKYTNFIWMLSPLTKTRREIEYDILIKSSFHKYAFFRSTAKFFNSL